MTSRQYAKAKGSKWERDVTEFLKPYFVYAEKAPRWGSKDKGDLVGTGIFTVECKAEKTITLASYMNEAVVEAANVGPDQIPVCFVKRRGKGVADGYAVFRIEDARLLMSAFNQTRM